MIRFPAPAAALACLALLLPATPAAARPRAAAQDDGWVRMKDPSECVEVNIPPGGEPESKSLPERILTLQWPDVPWRKLRMEVNAYTGQADALHLVKFTLSRLKGVYGSDGRHEAIEGLPTRFVNMPSGDDKVYLAYSQVQVEGKTGYVCTLVIHKSVWESQRGDFDRILDSFKANPAPVEAFTVPAGWKRVEAEYASVYGPTADFKDPAARAKFEDRLHQIAALWLDPDKSYRMFRELFDDTRKLVAKVPVKVMPTTLGFKDAAGAAYRTGVPAIYQHDSPEKVVLLDAQEDSGLNRAWVLAAAGTQYVETRTGPLPAWVRSGFFDYWAAASLRDAENPFPGAIHDGWMAHAKEVFKKKAPKFADLKALDDAGLAALGDDGRSVAWAYFHYLMNGPDEAPRNEFRRCLRVAVGSKDWSKAWAETHPKEDTRKVDSGCIKWVREHKPRK
jgi:hypothetical protein